MSKIEGIEDQDLQTLLTKLSLHDHVVVTGFHNPDTRFLTRYAATAEYKRVRSYGLDMGELEGLLPPEEANWNRLGSRGRGICDRFGRAFVDEGGYPYPEGSLDTELPAHVRAQLHMTKEMTQHWLDVFKTKSVCRVRVSSRNADELRPISIQSLTHPERPEINILRSDTLLLTAVVVFFQKTLNPEWEFQCPLSDENIAELGADLTAFTYPYPVEVRCTINHVHSNRFEVRVPLSNVESAVERAKEFLKNWKPKGRILTSETESPSPSNLYADSIADDFIR